ncbi:MAG: DUF3703 domain-containing protein [Woeseiaceae bacterium]
MSYYRNIGDAVRRELDAASIATTKKANDVSFRHLENAHVLGQSSTRWHTLVHAKMLVWGIRQRDWREAFGQTYRLLGALTKTFIGWVPHGNTGGANVSPLKSMPVRDELRQEIDLAKRRA